MSEITAIGTVLTSVKTAVEIAKLIKDSDSNLEKAEFKLQLAELISALADAKIELTEVQDLLIEKDNKIAELQGAFELKDKLVKKYDAYYTIGASGNAIGDPYCLSCWESRQKVYSIQVFSKDFRIKVCAVCNSQYAGRRTKVIVEQNDE